MKKGMKTIGGLVPVVLICAVAVAALMLLTGWIGHGARSNTTVAVVAYAQQTEELSFRQTTQEVALQTPAQTQEYQGENPLPLSSVLQLPELPNGCEFVSLCMVLEYYGYACDKVELVRKYCPLVPFAQGNPNQAYIGSPFAGERGLGCYAPVVLSAANRFLQDHEANLLAKYAFATSISSLLEWIDQGVPVILWATVDMTNDFSLATEWVADGEEFAWHRYSHCLVLTGYTQQSYIFQDPLRGQISYDRAASENSFTALGCQAIVITGAER